MNQNQNSRIILHTPLSKVLWTVLFAALSWDASFAQINFPSKSETSEVDYYKSLINDDFEKILSRYAFVSDFRIMLVVTNRMDTVINGR